MKKDVSPEEKLLNVIRAKKSESDNLSPTEKHDPYFGRFENPQASSNTASVFQKKLSNVERKWLSKISELKYLNIVLAIVLLSIGGYVIYELSSPEETPLFTKDLELVSVNEGSIPKTEQTNQGDEKPFSYYSDNLDAKDLFRAGSGQSEEVEKPKIDEEKIAKEIISNLSLMGIVKGDNPQAIIEDKKGQKSYFLNKGDAIGEATISDIFENKVIIDINGKQYELVL